ncbi:MAG: cupin domain-containing protein [Pseudomonadota bacterium]
MPADALAPPLNWPDGLSAERFLRDYWQKQPLLLRGALPGFESPLGADELAGLACDPDVESRLVRESGDPPWQVQQGPFAEDQLTGLPGHGWSLLVQDVDKHLPELAVIADRFGFVPSWRFDDLMVSFAPPGGSVGAHVDAYDVFLLQGAGQRTWSIGPQPERPLCHPEAQLRVIDNFAPEEQWTLFPGDALYLPPGVAHHGVAGENCITWSVGFRAPSHQQLVAAAGLPATRPPSDDALYADPDLRLEEAAPGLISPRAIDRANAIVARHCGGKAPPSMHWFGELVTQPKHWLRAGPGEVAGGPQELEAALKGGDLLVRHGMTRLARSADGQLLFVDGDTFAVAEAQAGLVTLVCTNRELDARALAPWLGQPEVMELVHTLVCRGALCLGSLENGPAASI